MAYASYSYGTTNNNPYNGYRPPYKIGDYFAMPDIATRLAPGFSGNDAKIMLISSVSIAVGGRGTSSADSQFGVWNGDGSNGYFSALFKLPDTGTGYPPKLNQALVSPKPVYGNATYLLGFLKRDTSLVIWGQDTTKSGTTRRDNTNSGNGSNFKDDAAFTSGASLVWTIYYEALPNVPNSVASSVSGNSATITWASPTLVAGETAITGYRIQRSTDNATWTTVNEVGAGTTSFTDVGLGWSTTYYYRVAAHNLVSNTFGSAYSGPFATSVSAVVGSQPNPPAPPATGKSTSYVDVTVANPSPSVVLFSDDGAGIPYEDIEIVFGSEYLYNRITAANTDGVGVIDTVTVDATTGANGNSQALYGVRGYDVGSDLLNINTTDLTRVANKVLYKTYQPNMRIESITIRLGKLSTDQVNTVLGLDIDYAIRTSFTPNKIGNPIIRVGRIIGIAHNIDVESHLITFRLEDLQNTPFVLDASDFGILNASVLG